MRYLLRKAVLEPVPEIDITKKQYAAYEDARHILSNSLAIEETYEIVISNYIAFEKQVLDTSTSCMVREYLNYSDFFKVRLDLNIRLVNLLTATKLYVDQLPQNVRDCLPDAENVVDVVSTLFQKEYDEYFEYRFMEALRNYVQHRGMPVHWASQRGEWTSSEGDAFLEYSMEVASLRGFLEEDEKFKKAVIKEMGEKVDLKYATRCYIECISNVHCTAREIVESSVAASRELLQDAHKQYAEVYKDSLVGLSACAISDDGQIASVPLLLDWDDIRLQLMKRNGKMTNLRKRYVTGRIKGQNQ